MAESNLTADVAAVSWAAAAGASAQETAPDEKSKSRKTRKRTFLNAPDADVDAGEHCGEAAHEIDSFA